MKPIKKVFTLTSIIFCSIVLLNSCSNFKMVDKSNEYENDAIEAFHHLIDEEIEKYEKKPILDIKKIDIINVDFSNEDVIEGGTPSLEKVQHDGYYTIDFKMTSNFYDYGIYVDIYPECNLEKKVKNLKSIHNINVYYSYNDKKEMEFTFGKYYYWILLDNIYFEVYRQNKSIIGDWILK